MPWQSTHLCVTALDDNLDVTVRDGEVAVPSELVSGLSALRDIIGACGEMEVGTLRESELALAHQSPLLPFAGIPVVTVYVRGAEGLCVERHVSKSWLCGTV